MRYIDELKGQDKAILDGVLGEFAQLAKIPRKSGHEKEEV